MSQLLKLSVFFRSGRTGTNQEIADYLGASTGGVRGMISQLRNVHGMRIVKAFPNRSATTTVYSHQPLLRSAQIDIGRPYLPR